MTVLHGMAVQGAGWSQSGSTGGELRIRAACVAETLTCSSVAAKGESGLVIAGGQSED